MKSLITFSLAIVLGFSSGICQNYVFRVMANNGSNEFKSISSSQWTPVKRGVAFKSGDVIKVADQAYLGLIHNTGKTVELIDPGTFKVDDIELNIDIRKKGIGSKYTEYVMNTLDSDAEFVGANEVATRGAEKSVNVIAPASSEVLDRKQIISWESEENNTYTIRIKGIFDDILLEEDVQSNEYLLDFENPSLSGEKTFVMTVTIKDQKESSKEYALDLLSEDESSKYQPDLLEIQQNVTNPLLKYLVMASYFEEKGLLIDAISSYHNAIKLAPEFEDVHALYRSFKVRNNLHL